MNFCSIFSLDSSFVCSFVRSFVFQYLFHYCLSFLSLSNFHHQVGPFSIQLVIFDFSSFSYFQPIAIIVSEEEDIAAFANYNPDEAASGAPAVSFFIMKMLIYSAILGIFKYFSNILVEQPLRQCLILRRANHKLYLSKIHKVKNTLLEVSCLSQSSDV